MKKFKFKAFIPNFRQDYFFSIVLLPTVSVSFVRCREAPEITFLMGWLFWGFEVRGARED
jgi:hypothetical protein